MLIDQWLGHLWDFLLECSDVVSQAPSHLESQHWIILSVVCVVVGCICMRGYGSRKDY